MSAKVSASMMLITVPFSVAHPKTFRLIPVTLESPYVEGVYDPEREMLVLISKEKKQGFHMLPRLNDEGYPERPKQGPPRDSNLAVKLWKEERKSVETYAEYYITEKEEIKAMVQMLSVNAGTFKIDEMLKKSEIAPVEKPKIILTTGE